MNKDFTQDDFIKQFGTDEQKKELEERQQRYDKFLEGIPVLTFKEMMDIVDKRIDNE